MKKLVDGCLAAVQGLVRRHQEMVEANADLARALAAEKERIDGMLDIKTKEAAANSHSNSDSSGSDEKDLYNWEADHGY